MGQPHMGSVAVQEAGGATVLVLRGEHDLATVPLVEDALGRARSGAPIVVDLTDVGFIDSSIISVLVRYSRPEDSCRAWSQLAVVVPEEGFIRKLLVLVGMDRIVPVFSRVGDALAAMEPVSDAQP